MTNETYPLEFKLIDIDYYKDGSHSVTWVTMTAQLPDKEIIFIHYNETDINGKKYDDGYNRGSRAGLTIILNESLGKTIKLKTTSPINELRADYDGIGLVRILNNKKPKSKGEK